MPQPPQRHNVLLLLALIGTLAISLFVLRPSWEIGGDGFSYYAWIRSPLFDGDFDFSNERAWYDERFSAYTLEGWKTAAGKAGNPFAVGSALVWLPFVLGAHAVSSLASLPPSQPLAGFSPPYFLAVGIGTAGAAIIGLLFLFRALTVLFSPAASAVSVLLIFLASPLLYYLIYEPSMAHGASILPAALLLWYAVRKLYLAPPVPLSAFAAGALAGMSFLIRWQDALLVLVPVILIAFSPRRKSFALYMATAAGFLIPASIQMAAWRMLYESWVAVPQGASFFAAPGQFLVPFLVSPFHGLFAFHPLLVFGFAGMLFLARSHKRWAAALAAPLTLSLLLNGSLNDWFGGSSFGARRITSMLPIISFGVAAIAARIPRTRFTTAAITLLLAVGAGWNYLLMAAAARGILPLSRPISAHDLLTAPLRMLGW